MDSNTRTTQSARVWRSERMVERHAARIMADRAAEAAVAQARPPAAETVPTPIAAGTNLLNTRHIVPAPEAPRDRQDRMTWTV